MFAPSPQAASNFNRYSHFPPLEYKYNMFFGKNNSKSQIFYKKSAFFTKPEERSSSLRASSAAKLRFAIMIAVLT